jgi:hypothetical protein
MSTKTTFKRVALVTVAALGFGGLSVVVAPSASASEMLSSEITSVTIATPSAGRLNTTFLSTVSVIKPAVSVTTDGSITLRARFDSTPAGSKSVVGFSTAGQTMVDTTGATSVADTIRAANAASNELLPAMMQLDPGSGESIAVSSAGSLDIAGSVGFIPDTVGAYVVTVWHDYDLDGALDATEDSSTKTFTVGSSPTTLTVTRINSSAATGATGNGALVKLTLTNGGVAAGLSAGEGIVITPATGGDIRKVNGTDQCATAASAACTLTSGMFIGGVAWLNITNATAGASQVYTFAGSGTDVAGISGTFLLTFRTSATIATATTVITGEAETAFVDGVDGIDGTSTTAYVPHAATTLTYYTAATATVGTTSTTYSKATVTDTNGRVTGSVAQGITGLAYDIAYLLSETAAAATTAEGSFSVSMTPGAIGDGFQVVTDAGTALTSTVATAAAAAAAPTVSPASTQPLSVKNGGSVVYTVTQLDQFGNALPNVLVTLGGGSKNAVVVAPTKSTDANGLAQFTWTDAQAAAAVAAGLTTDAPTFTTSAGTVTGGTITWSATGPVVGTVTILGGDNGTTTGVKSTTVTEYDIAAGDGAEAGVQTFTATVKDAAGNLLSGVPVTWTVSGTTAGVLSTTATGYTTAAGVDSASVYGWVNGNYTVTATAGGIAGTAGYTLRQQTALEARAISATVSGTIVTATVKDRFGNVVPGVTVYATKTGVGYFGAGVTSTSAATNTAGIAEFVIAGGDAEVTVSTLDPNAAAGTKAYGQTCAAASFVGCASTSVALTAYTAGTALEAEEGVGASLSAAGVSSAKVSVTGDSTAQTAADAAAEATDAANAATDAANAAAEAADAATAAAQDAADAVAALSAQVATLISGLKSQLTALTNLVIKIQKKVKA